MTLYNTTPISNLMPGTAVLGTDIYAATDITDLMQSPAGSTKKYTVNQLQNYVSTQIRGVGIPSVMVATTQNLVAFYNNGAVGVGAVLVGALVAIVINGVTLELNDTVLVKDQTLPIENGIYYVSTVGSMSEPWVLTRSTYYDGASRIPNYGDFVGVISGTVAPLSFYFQTADGPIVIGTDPIIFQRELALPTENWITQTTTPATLQVNTGYTSSAGATLITYTLPATAAAGSWIEINAQGSGLYTIAQNAGQTIHYSGFPDTTVGTGGSLTAAAAGSCVKLRCVVANTTWEVVSSVGTFVII